MKRAWRIFLRLGLVATVAALAVVISSAWWLPGYLATRVVSAAEEAGLGPARVGEVRYGWTWVEAVDLRLGGDRLVLPSVAVTFSPLDLLRGRVDEVRVDGGEWTIEVSEGAVDWSPLGSLASGDEGGPVELPFDRLRIDGFRLRFELPEGQVVQPVWAWLIASSSGESADAMASLREPTPAEGGWRPPTGPLADPFVVAAKIDLRSLTLASLDAAVRHDLVEGDAIGRVVEAWSGVAVRGRVEAFGGVLRDGTPRTPLTIAWRDGEALDRGGAFTVRGIEATVEWRGTAPAWTPPGQTLTWDEARIGEIVASDGGVRFAIEPSGLVYVERAGWEIDGGRFALAPFGVDPASPDARTRLALEHISLDRWLSLVSMGHVTGSGRVSGEVGFRVALEPRLRFAFGEGEVTADGPGVLSVVDLREAEAFVRERELVALEDLDYGAEVRGRVVEALGEFAYDELSFRFQQTPGTPGVVMRLTTSGRGVRGARQPFERLSVNVTGVNGLVNEVLQQKLGLDRLRERWNGRLLDAREDRQGDER